MPPRKTPRQARSRVVDALGFWLITLVICALAGALSYKFGRDWFGERLQAEEEKRRVTTNIADRIDDLSRPPGSADAEPPSPPSQAVIVVEDREPTEAERSQFGSGDKPKPDEADDQQDDPKPKPDADTDAEADKPDAAVEPDATAGAGDSGDEPSAGRYTVRAGSFAEAENAQRMVDALRERGYQPWVSTVEKDGVAYQRVNVASFDSQESAVELRKELRAEGYEADLEAE